MSMTCMRAGFEPWDVTSFNGRSRYGQSSIWHHILGEANPTAHGSNPARIYRIEMVHLATRRDLRPTELSASVGTTLAVYRAVRAVWRRLAR